MADVEHLKRELLRHVREAGGRLSGPELGTRLQVAERQVYKDAGFAKLGDFVRAHLEHEMEVLPGGFFQLTAAEPLESPAMGPLVPSAPRATTIGNLFKLWKSPTSHYHLRVNRTTGGVRQVPSGTPSDADEAELQPPDNDFHRDLALQYVTQVVPASWTERFKAAISSEDPRWWERWNELFLECHAEFPQGKARWLRFRHEGIVARLREQIDALGLAKGLSTEALRQILASDRDQGPAEGDGAAPRRAAPPSLIPLRDAVVEAVGRLTDDELRQVWLPAGILYDVLARRR